MKLIIVEKNNEKIIETLRQRLRGFTSLKSKKKICVLWKNIDGHPRKINRRIQ